MFPFGNSPTRVDEKGRLKLPADLKRVVDEEYGPKFFITSRDGERAEIYPQKEWDEYAKKLEVVPNFNPAKQKLMNRVSYFGQNVEMDSQGRLLIPQLVREKLKLTGDVLVFGMQSYLEVANREAFEQQMSEAPITLDDRKELEKFGL
jgi:MraZ protein